MAWTERFRDLFTDTPYTDLVSHTVDLGAGWAKGGGGTIRIAGSGTTVGNAGGANYYPLGTFQPMQAVEIVMLSATDSLALVVRGEATGGGEFDVSGYVVLFDGSGGAGAGLIRLQRRDSGTPSSTLADMATFTFGANALCRVEISSAYVIDALVDGVSVGGDFPYNAVADTPNYAGNRPMVYYGASVDGWGDSFRVYDDGGAEPPTTAPFRTRLTSRRKVW
jgi:hypothetical protein